MRPDIISNSKLNIYRIHPMLSIVPLVKKLGCVLSERWCLAIVGLPFSVDKTKAIEKITAEKGWLEKMKYKQINP